MVNEISHISPLSSNISPFEGDWEGLDESHILYLVVCSMSCVDMGIITYFQTQGEVFYWQGEVTYLCILLEIPFSFIGIFYPPVSND